MAAKKSTLSKSDFIRQQPSTLSAAEVVAKGRAAGMTILPGLVYEVRRTAKARGAAKRPSTAAKGVDSRAPVTMSKAAFVRAHANLSPKEIVAKAKAHGMRFDVSYVYRVRGYDKSKAKKPTKAAARAATPATRGTARLPRPITTASSAENLLKALGAELGLGRAIEVLAGERARVRAVLGG